MRGETAMTGGRGGRSRPMTSSRLGSRAGGGSSRIDGVCSRSVRCAMADLRRWPPDRVAPHVADHGVTAVGHAGDEFVDVGQLCCSKDLVFVASGHRRRFCRDGAVQQHGFSLATNPSCGATVRVVVARGCLHRRCRCVRVGSRKRAIMPTRGFAAAGMPKTISHHLPGWTSHVILQHGTRVVGEGTFSNALSHPAAQCGRTSDPPVPHPTSLINIIAS